MTWGRSLKDTDISIWDSVDLDGLSRAARGEDVYRAQVHARTIAPSVLGPTELVSASAKWSSQAVVDRASLPATLWRPALVGGHGEARYRFAGNCTGISQATLSPGPELLAAALESQKKSLACSVGDKGPDALWFFDPAFQVPRRLSLPSRAETRRGRCPAPLSRALTPYSFLYDATAPKSLRGRFQVLYHMTLCHASVPPSS